MALTPISLCPISLCPYVPKSLCPFVSMFFCLYAHMSLNVPMFLYVSEVLIFVYPYVTMSVCLHFTMTLCPFVPMSICPYDLSHVDKSKHMYWLHSGKFGEAMSYQIQMPLIFLILFSDIGQCFRTTQTKSLENQKSGHVSII